MNHPLSIQHLRCARAALQHGDRASARIYTRSAIEVDQQADAEALARHLAGLFNALVATGLPISRSQIEQAREEVASRGWDLVRHSGRWSPRRAPQRYRRVKKGAPGAVPKTVDGRTWYIDAEQARREAEGGGGRKPRAKQEPGKGKPTRSQPAKAGRMADKATRESAWRKRGAVDTASLGRFLDQHKTELPTAERGRAAAAARQLQRHHGEFSLHRLEDLVGLAREGLEAAKDPQLRSEWKSQLGRYKHMLDVLQQAKPQPGAPREAPAAKPPPKAPPAKPKSPPKPQKTPSKGKGATRKPPAAPSRFAQERIDVALQLLDGVDDEESLAQAQEMIQRLSQMSDDEIEEFLR